MLARRHEVLGLSACTDPDHQLPRTERLQLDTKKHRGPFPGTQTVLRTVLDCFATLAMTTEGRPTGWARNHHPVRLRLPPLQRRGIYPVQGPSLFPSRGWVPVGRGGLLFNPLRGNRVLTRGE